MKYLEVRRHTMRQKPGKHLSQAGVELARRIGKASDRFDRVFSSPKPRAIETAIAMGYAVDREIEGLGLDAVEDKVWEELEGEAGFDGWGRQVKKSKLLVNFGKSQAKIWQESLEALPEGDRGLMITHGGFIEAGAVGLLPDANHPKWGGFCDYCEGVAVSFDGKAYKLKILRVTEKIKPAV